MALCPVMASWFVTKEVWLLLKRRVISLWLCFTFLGRFRQLQCWNHHHHHSVAGSKEEMGELLEVPGMNIYHPCRCIHMPCKPTVKKHVLCCAPKNINKKIGKYSLHGASGYVIEVKHQSQELDIESGPGISKSFPSRLKNTHSCRVAHLSFLCLVGNVMFSQTIHVWYIYLHLPYFTIKNNQM